MVDTPLIYHRKYSNFFTPSECNEIISIVNRYKEYIPTGTYQETGYEGLTSSYQLYNWLHHPEIQPYNIEQRLFNLPQLQEWEYMVLQCWVNELHVGESLHRHYHGEQVPHESMRRYDFYSANVFLGGEFNETWYADSGIVHNELGDIHIFASNLDHEVSPNTGHGSRYSMAIDIHPRWCGNNKMDNTHRWRVTKNVQT